ncbi:hypothetical protein [Streptomyces sp. NPDC004685]
MTQTADTPPGPPRGSLPDEVKSAVTPRAALLVIGVIALQLLFIASCVGAPHNPKPKDVAFGVATPVPAVAQQTADRLDRLPGSPLDPRTVTGAAAARDKVMNREGYGALITDPRGTTDTLLVAPGGGTVLPSALDGLITTLEAAQHRTVRTVDVAPASPQDFDGLSSFYLVAGNPSAGGAFPLPMLPPFWKAIGPALPPGAGTWVARSIAALKGNTVTGPLLAPAAWAVAGIVVTMAASVFRGRRKPGPGAPRTLRT